MSSTLLGTEELPTEVVIDGARYAINGDFRRGILFESIVFDERMPEAEKVTRCLQAWFDDKIPTADIKAVFDAVFDFYRCGKPAGQGDSDSKRHYDFKHDDDLIYAAFLQEYGIDLFKIEGLHWWKFRAMLSALSSECRFMEVIGYRSMKISKDMSAEQRRHVHKMRAMFALPTDGDTGAVRIRDEAHLKEVLAEMEAAREATSERDS